MTKTVKKERNVSNPVEMGKTKVDAFLNSFLIPDNFMDIIPNVHRDYVSWAR